jgi:hypothetical protein
MTEIAESAASRGALETMVAEADTGGRKPGGVARRIVFVIALGWSLFQVAPQRNARLGQPDGISPSRMAEMLGVDKAGPKVRC